MGKIIKSHNKKLINKNKRNPPTCNCQKKAECPLNGKCTAENIVYSARVTINEDESNPRNPVMTKSSATRTQPRRTTDISLQPNESESTDDDHNTTSSDPTQFSDTQPQTPLTKEMNYIGAAENFKQRYRNHIKSFRHEIYSKDTVLSKYIWTLNKLNLKYSINWRILKHTSGYNKVTKSCNLCINEKLEICKFKDKRKLLNKRNELVSKCRHGNKYLLANLPDP